MVKDLKAYSIESLSKKLDFSKKIEDELLFDEHFESTSLPKLNFNDKLSSEYTAAKHDLDSWDLTNEIYSFHSRQENPKLSIYNGYSRAKIEKEAIEEIPILIEVRADNSSNRCTVTHVVFFDVPNLRKEFLVEIHRKMAFHLHEDDIFFSNCLENNFINRDQLAALNNVEIPKLLQLNDLETVIRYYIENIENCLTDVLSFTLITDKDVQGVFRINGKDNFVLNTFVFCRNSPLTDTLLNLTLQSRANGGSLQFFDSQEELEERLFTLLDKDIKFCNTKLVIEGNCDVSLSIKNTSKSYNHMKTGNDFVFSLGCLTTEAKSVDLMLELLVTKNTEVGNLNIFCGYHLTSSHRVWHKSRSGRT